MQFQSNALWPAGVCSSKYGDNISTDLHATQAQAEGVCEGLERDGFGGERKHFPIRTWVNRSAQIPPQIPDTNAKDDYWQRLERSEER